MTGEYLRVSTYHETKDVNATRSRRLPLGALVVQREIVGASQQDQHDAELGNTKMP